MYEQIAVENRGSVLIITLNRPRVLNAITQRMRKELTEVLQAASHDDGVGSIILTGTGDRAFAAGMDLEEAKGFGADRAKEMVDEFDAVYSALRNLGKVSIVAINGYAVGAGLQIALLTDIRIAVDYAKLGMPEINDGIPCITGTWTLWDIVGRARTTDLVLTGRLLDAQEALEWGLVNRVVLATELMPAALELGEELAGKPQMAVRLNKERWRRLGQAAAEDAREFGKYAHALAFSSDEPRAAMEAFLAKRRARP